MSGSIGDDVDLPTPRILMVLSNKGLDPTSVAKPWKALRDQGYIVEFATEYGQIAKAEQRFLERSWFRQAMGRSKWEVDLFYQMVGTDEFLAPHAWGQPGFSFAAYDAVIFPGVFNKTLNQYTDSKTLQNITRSYFPLTKRLVATPPKARTFDIVFKRRSTASDEDFLPEEVLKIHEDGLRNYQGPRKVIGAIGRGVLVLAGTKCNTGEVNGQAGSSSRSTESNSRPPSRNAPAEETITPAPQPAEQQAESSPPKVVVHAPDAVEATPASPIEPESPRKVVRRRSSNLLNTKKLSLNGLTQKVLRRSNTVSAVELRKSKNEDEVPAHIPRSLTTIDETKKVRRSTDSEARPRPSLSRRSFNGKRRSMPTGPVSVLYNIETTAVPTWMESVGTTLALAYGIRGMYRSFGPKKSFTQADVTKELEGPHLFHSGPKTLAPFSHVDPTHHYVSARYPGDAELFSNKLIEEIQLARKEWGKKAARPHPPPPAEPSTSVYP